MNMTEKPPAIMVVDDTPANLQLLDEMLRGWGFQGRLFPRGRLALSSAVAEPPDLILLDIFMPEMDGYETCRQFKAVPALQSIPVIFISGLNEPMDKAKAFTSGGVDYLTKPFQIEEVRARIETHLKAKRLQDALEAQARQLREREDRLRELETARTGLVNLIVHDMRSPLMAISGYLDMLLMDDAVMPAGAVESLKQAARAAQRLTAMIASLPDAGRTGCGPCRLVPVPGSAGRPGS